VLRHYLTSSWRSLLSHKLIAFISLLGLTLAIGSSLPFFLIIRHELTFDHFHQKANRTYRVYLDRKDQPKTGNVHVPAAGALREDFPEFENITQIKGPEDGKITVRNNENEKEVYKEENVFYIDINFLKIFDFHVLTSFDTSLLSQPYQVLITPELARKYFNTTDVVGKSISLGDHADLQIIGLIKSPPSNSDFQFKILISFATYLKLHPEKINDWLWFDCSTFVSLKKDDNPIKYRQRLETFTERHAAFYKSGSYYYRLQPLKEVHTDNSYEFFDAFYHTPPELLWIPGLLALTIIIMASANFVNLSVAFSLRLAHEAGIRKVMGSSKSQLIIRLTLQNLLLLLLAATGGLFLAKIILNKVNELFAIVQYNLELDFSSLGVVFCLGLLIFVLASAYPILVLAHTPPQNVLRERTLGSGKNFSSTRKFLVVFQIFSSTILLLSTLVITAQINNWRSTDYKFRKDNILIFPVPQEMVSKKQVLRNLLLHIPGVQQVSFSSGNPSSGGFTSIKLPDGNSVKAGIVSIDENFLDLYEISPIYGHINLQDTIPSLLINSKLALQLGFDPPESSIGSLLIAQWLAKRRTGKIACIIPDYYSSNPVNKSIAPQALIYDPGQANKAYVATVKDPSQFKAEIEQAFKEVFPDEYFQPSTLTLEIELSYLLELILQKAVRLIAILAMLISGIGILGIVSYMGIQRRKEFSVRKVFGAGVWDIMKIMFLEFGIIMSVGFLAGSTAGYFIMQDWLIQYSNHIELKIIFFAESIIIITLLFFLTIQYQIIKTSRENPAEVLRGN